MSRFFMFKWLPRFWNKIKKIEGTYKVNVKFKIKVWLIIKGLELQ